MAHRRANSVRYPAMGSPVLDMESPPFTPASLSFAALGSLAARKPRSYWYRTTFLALFALVVVSVYVLLVAQPTLPPISLLKPNGSQASRLSSDAFRLAALRHKRPGGDAITSNAARPQITLDPAQELAAVTSFLASLPQNVISSSVDPSKPIDPQLVLDFDTRSPGAMEEVDAVVHDLWARNPVILYSKYYSPVSRELKQILDDLHIRPSPTIIEVDQRPDEAVLAPLLFRLTSSSELPILLVGGHPVGTMQEIRYMDKKGDLRRMITQAGGEIDGARRKKGKKF